MSDNSVPPPNDEYSFDFSAQSEAFLETFFRKGAQFTEQLLTETQKMRNRISQLTEENIRLRGQLASDDAVRDLLAKIKDLEEEKHNIRKTADNVVREFRDYEGRYEEMERELDQMANLYVASSQLHATMAPAEVFSVMEQVLIQLVGAAQIGIYLRVGRGDNKALRPVHSFNCPQMGSEVVPWGEPPIGEVAQTQVSFVTEPHQGTTDGPIACIPINSGDQCIGVVVIYSLLEQKDHFVDVDYELFRLLSQHGAQAIIGSGLLAQKKDLTEALDCFSSL